MTRYEKGKRYEHEVKELFENAGYEVTRSAASKSPFDLIAVKYTDPPFGSSGNKKICFVAFIQCKVRALNKVPGNPGKEQVP